MSVERTAQGIERFIIGLIKKIFIANVFAEIADTIFAVHPMFVSSEALWIAAIAYSLQIYFDFSAYSDMAIGLAKVFGFDFHENFNYPYISKSIKEFWRRWHISLSTWFRDYLYIPLGGSRVSNIQIYRNLFLVFFATGLWHGASWNFVLWGLWHGLFIVVERVGFDKILDRLWKPIQHIYTLFVVVVGWVIFRADTFTDARLRILRMLYMDRDISEVVYNTGDIVSARYLLMGLIALAFCFPIFVPIRKKIQEAGSKYHVLMLPYYGVLALLLIGILAILSAGTHNPFIYFRF